MVKFCLPRFLLTVLLAGWAGSAMGAEDGSLALEKLGWKLSLQAWTAHHTSLWETVALAKSVGITYLELYPGQVIGGSLQGGFDHKSSIEIRRQVQAYLAEMHIVPIAYGVVNLPPDEMECRTVFSFAKEMGMEVINSEPKKEAFPIIESMIAEFNLRVGIHNHPRPSRYWDPAVIVDLIAGHDARLGACADTGHWPRSGMQAGDGLRALAGHIQSIHLKETDTIGSAARDVVFGAGVTRVAEQLAELKRQNFRGPISIEYESGKESVELVGDLKCMVAAVEAAAVQLVDR